MVGYGLAGGNKGPGYRLQWSAVDTLSTLNSQKTAVPFHSPLKPNSPFRKCLIVLKLQTQKPQTQC